MINPFSIHAKNGTHFSIHLHKQEFNLSSNPFLTNPFPQTAKFSIFTPKFTTPFPESHFLTPKSQLPPFRKISASFNALYSQTDGSTSTSSASLNTFNFDDYLSIFEFLSLASSAAISLYAARTYGVQKGAVFGWVGSKIFVWQYVVLVASIVVGAVIRRRQWRRVGGGGLSASHGNNLLRRVEKLEEDLRSSATLIRVLSRQLEKLGIRVRVTRKVQKEPISETAALAQKNSEATRALAAQEDILEKELGEIQKALLAMQEQQQKHNLSSFLQLGKLGTYLTPKMCKLKTRISPRLRTPQRMENETKSRLWMLQKQVNND